MGFFNEDFYKEMDKNYKNEEESVDEFDLNNEDNFKDSSYYANNMNLEVNKQNNDKYKDIMNNDATKYDFYWDSKNIIIRLFLVILFIIIVVGLIYYIVGWSDIF